MKQIIALLLSVLTISSLKAQVIYAEDYGDKQNPAVIFIHGGPSGNSNLFEGTTAQELADKGFYVIVYDRRGEGCSKDDNATMTFDENFEDLLSVYQKYNLSKASILAHSFGGIMATLFTDKYPEKVNALILAGALFSQQETYNHILKQAKAHFKYDSVKLTEISEIEKLDKNGAKYRKRCYEIAGELKHFTMSNPTEESKSVRLQYENSEFYKTNFRNTESPEKFYQNESRNNLDNTAVLKNIRRKGVPIFAVYGKDDGIFSVQQLSDLRKIVGPKNFSILYNCSHYLFADQRTQFIRFIEDKL